MACIRSGKEHHTIPGVNCQRKRPGNFKYEASNPPIHLGCGAHETSEDWWQRAQSPKFEIAENARLWPGQLHLDFA